MSLVAIQFLHLAGERSSRRRSFGGTDSCPHTPMPSVADWDS